MAKKKPDVPQLAACVDRERRSCIQVARQAGNVKYIPLDVFGLSVATTSEEEFDERFKPLVDYPIERACRLYLGYSGDIGATEEALGYLGQVIEVTRQEFNMATSKKAAQAPAAKTKAPAAKTKAPAAKTKAPAAKTKAPAAKTKAPAAKEPGAKGASAAQMFKDLIMAGQLTDDKIFEKVAAQFGLDEKKRGYVKWYRNDLKKKGANPPDAKA